MSEEAARETSAWVAGLEVERKCVHVYADALICISC
jgi:hypothetical protein